MMVALNIKNILKGQDGKLQMDTYMINFIIIPLFIFFNWKIIFNGK
jgi:hypothetical protein